MRSRYASIEMAGTLRAWKHSVADGDDSACADAVSNDVTGGDASAADDDDEVVVVMVALVLLAVSGV
jgi:hypothetical protein